jgi:hypothetical protein
MVLIVTRRVTINTERPRGIVSLSINSPTWVRPNTDTLYSQLWPGCNL